MDKPKDKKSALKVHPGIDPPSNVNQKLAISPSHHLTTKQYVTGILQGNRVLLAKAITLVESSRADHQQQAQEIIAECLRHSKSNVSSQTLEPDIKPPNDESGIRDPGSRIRHHCHREQSEAAASAIRIGITGVPGAGKSTFIEALGKHLTARGYRLAVLAVDPSSTVSKGSILGDKTRMESLAVDPNAFIRPSPSAGTLGGVARKTRETILLCEAAGFDVIFVETVGVGQSETAVKSMVDFFLLLMLAGAGDELQGIKRGIIEMADAVIINKADGDNLSKAKIAAAEYSSALHLFPPSHTGWIPVVDTCSAKTGDGIPRVWETVEGFFSTMTQHGHFQRNRTEQNRHVFRQAIEEQLQERFYKDPSVKKRLADLEKKVAEGSLNPYLAAVDLITG